MSRSRASRRSFRADKSLEGFDFAFNAKTDRALIFELATARFVSQAEDALFLGPPGSGKSHLAPLGASLKVALQE